MKTELKEYILEKRQVLGAAALGLLISSGVLFLYQLPLEAVWYSVLLVCFAEALWLFTGFGKFRKKQKLLRQLAGEQRRDFSIRDLPESEDPKEEAYQELIESLMKEKGRKDAETAERLRDMEEYYTLWVHQIKTPIAAMSLLLQEEDTPENGELSMELFHIEQYVEISPSGESGSGSGHPVWGAGQLCTPGCTEICEILHPEKDRFGLP